MGFYFCIEKLAYGNQISLKHVYIIHVYILCRHGLGKQGVIPIQDFTFGTLFWLNFGTLFPFATLTFHSPPSIFPQKKEGKKNGQGILEVIKEGLWG